MVAMRDIRSFIVILFNCIGFVGVAIGMYYAYLVNSWAGHRPLTPDALHPYAYTNHGVYYLGAADLALTRLLLVSCWSLAIFGAVGSWLTKRLGRAPSMSD